MSEPALLAGPFQLHRRFVAARAAGALFLTIAALGVTGAYLAWQWKQAGRIRHDAQVWAAGAPSEVPAAVDGKMTSRKFIFNSYELNVRYEDAQGQGHRGTSEFDTLFSRVDQDVGPTVRYLKEDPSVFALNWGMDVLVSRWMAVAFMVVVGAGLLGGSLGAIAYSLFRRLRNAQRAVDSGVETHCEVTRIEEQVLNGRATGNRIFHVRLPEKLTGGQTVELKETFNPKKGMPLLVEGKVLALVPPEAPRSALVLRADLYPLALDERTKQAVLNAVRQRNQSAATPQAKVG